MKNNAFSRVLGLTLLVSLILGESASSSDLLVGSFNTNEVLRYDGHTGAFLAAFVTAGSGGLSGTGFLTFGPDSNLYVGRSFTKEILRYDGRTGAFLGVFIPAGSGGLGGPLGLVFGSDGNLYVADAPQNGILRYNGQTGAFLGVFVPTGSGGLLAPDGIIFGPDGNLYACSANHQILRYDGNTGAFLGVFASGDSFFRPGGLVFGPDGNLYVTSILFTNKILRFDGHTGTLLGVFATFDAPGVGLVFGPDGNLYVGNVTSNQVLRFDASGAFLDVFASGGGLSGPTRHSLAPRQLTALSPAKVWIGLKNSDDVGLRVDPSPRCWSGTEVQRRRWARANWTTSRPGAAASTMLFWIRSRSR
jgi:DNA-binding beta-propeller fold protein YncE